MNINHKEWDSYLKGIAHNWASKCRWLAEDEAYSELLVWYAEALHNYNESKGTFSTFFYYYQHKAYRKLKEQWEGFNKVAAWDIEDALDIDDKKAISVIHDMLIELDKVYLSADAQEMLKFILCTDLTAGNKHKRVGKRTVIDKAQTMLGWSYTRSKKAIDTLKVFYGERAIA